MISIIVPVYNTGEYLHKCVESILSQTYKDLDIIIVDDGSHNSTAKVCDEIARMDSRIRVFHKLNEGVSVARNYGLSKVKGEYVGFVDSDDWVDPSMYQVLMDKMQSNKTDIVYCDATTIWKNNNIELDTFASIPQSFLCNTSDLSPLRLREIAGSVCRALYRYEIINKNDIKFPEGLKLSEDRIFNLSVLSKSSCLYYVKDSFYYRFMRDGSCVNSYHPDASSILLRSSAILQKLANENWGHKHSEAFLQQMVTGFMGILYGILSRPQNNKSRFLEFKQVASTPELHSAITSLCLCDIRSRLIKANQNCLLYFLIKIHILYKKVR